MKANKYERNAQQWLIKEGLAEQNEIVTRFPDIYIPSTKEFYEVKSLQIPKYGAPRAYFSIEQWENFTILNPMILAFHPGNPLKPLWHGRFQALSATPNLPFTILIYDAQHDKQVRKSM
jgi:hypothetical protein